MIEDMIDGVGGGWGFGAALVIGVGLVAIRGGRPLAKRAVRGWLAVSDSARGLSGGTGASVRGVVARVSDSVRGVAADVVEQAQDLYAESKAEVAGRTNKANARA